MYSCFPQRDMKRFLLRFLLYGYACIFLSGLLTAHALEPQAYKEFAATIEKELGLSPEEFRIIDASISNLLDKGIPQPELQKIVTEFKAQNIRRVDFYKDSLDGLYGLLSRAQSPAEALAFLW